MNVRNGFFCKCCVDVGASTWNIKEVISAWMEMWFLGKVIGELGQDKSVGLGILIPGGVGKEAILLLHTGLGQRDILEGRGRQEWTVCTSGLLYLGGDLVCVSGV